MSGPGNATGTAAVPTDPSVFSDIVAGVEGFLGTLNGNSVQIVGGVQELLPLIGDAVNVFVPGATLGGIAVTKLIAVAGGLLSGAPDVVNAWTAIQTAANGGPAPTPEQWAAFDGAADAAHSDLQAAIAAYAAQARPTATAAGGDAQGTGGGGTA